MNILLDVNLSPSWIPFLEKEEYETKHWSTIGPLTASDMEIMEWARTHNYVVFTHDLDFGTLLHVTRAVSPSVIQLRSEDVRPQTMSQIIIKALKKAEKELEQGALIIIDARKSRIRLLPLKRKNR
ncbi:MAG: DUF5615 family PIN-like protein [Deltaproteobacteria bacterium]|mgnify:CR=1 FL=1|nr:DUF5615 family PIN-like protein [Deltaproteobacteria bacterium]MBW1924781.1 DUF5615 family PIN-like protein [Deltaproteobacteria bacterium]MBW1948296.1 DUF5615 family PIN-like protein [Deltaproteobacteria bacterium]MBW2009818.1 DUF5615 family PIN-like protein [Deltaproteobacteria bacterium]RLB33270.1 MAG: hypothetical protein DRH20_13640 [Deltaproteobacteria bacterium]